MKKGVMYVICGAAGLAVIGGVAMYLLMPESVDVVKAAPQDLTEYVREKGTIAAKTSHLNEKEAIACVTKSGEIFANISANLDAPEWAYVLAHNLLHLAFGHFDKEKMHPNTQSS